MKLQVSDETGAIHTNGLRDFFNETCADSPELRTRLEQEGCLRIRELRLAEKRAKHFPKFA